MPVAETDLGWHLALGRLISTRGLPHTNSLAWTEPDHPFYATSWLFDLVACALAQSLGLLGVQLLTFALIAVCFSGVTAACALVSKHGWWVPLTVAWLTVPRITPRPHMASWAILAVCLALCLHAVEQGPRWRLACLPLIALGSNLHAGAVFSAAVLGVCCLLAAWRHKAWARELGIGACALPALMLNPGGPYNVWYTLRHLSLYEDLVPIQELQTPRLADLPAFWASILPVLALAYLARRRLPALLPLAALFAVAGAFAARLAFKHYLVAAPALALGAELLPRPLTRAVPAALLALALSTNVGRYLQLELGARWDERELPTRALAFIREHHLSGRFYNSLGDGGFLAWERPETPVFQDARMLAYSAGFFRSQLATEHAPERFAALMDQWKIGWALTSATPGSLTGNGLLGDAGWALVYWDELSELRVRRGGPLEGLELRTLRPDRDVEAMVTDLREAPDDQLPRLRAEVERVRQARPMGDVSAVFECALSRREKRGDEGACTRVPEPWRQVLTP